MSEAREAAVAKLSFGQERESGAHREDLFRQAQIYATLAVADEIAALREAVDNLRADVRYAGDGEEGRSRTTRRLTAVEEAIWGRYHGKHRDAGLLNKVNYLTRRVDALESAAPVESEEK